MKWSLSLGKLAGIKLFVHWTFFILLAILAFMGVRRGMDMNQLVWYLLFILTLFFCVLLHELGHALAARRYKIQTKDIMLLPIGGLARLENIPEDPKQELVIAVAGPLVNVGIAIFLFVILQIFPIGISPEDISEDDFAGISQFTFLPMLLILNIVLAVFNMIPAFPMDGGRVLRAFLSFSMPRTKATKIAAKVGQVIAVGFIIIGIMGGNFVLMLVAVFVFLAAQSESNFTQAKTFLQGYKVRDVVMHKFNTLHSTEPLSKAIDILLNGQGKDFLVVENGTVAGTLSRNEMIKALSEKGKEATIDSVMNKEVKFLQADMPLEELYAQAQQPNASLMPVVENGELIGVLDTENILEFIMIKEAEERNQMLRD
jgi:Zn-dependent protease/predicted transcriptional regulator